MTNDHAIKTPQDEEAFLLQQLMSARYAVEEHRRETSMRTLIKNKLNKELETIEAAVTDFMINNGVKRFHVGDMSVTISETESVDAPDIGAIPPEFIRLNTTVEPNKILIKELRPVGNWYSIQKSYKIIVKGE